MARRSRYALLLGTHHRHPKTAVTSLQATGVWTLCSSYAADNETDGFVPTGVVEGFCRKAGRRWRPVLEELLEPKVTGTSSEPTPWLHRSEHGYNIHDFDDVNITKQQASDVRRMEADRKAALRTKQNQGVSPNVPMGHGAGQEEGQRAGHTAGHQSGQEPDVPRDLRHRTQDTGHKDNNDRARVPLRTEEGVARVFQSAAVAAAQRKGHLTAGGMFPLMAHRQEYGWISSACEALGEGWPDFIGWWWRPGGWAEAHLTAATPKALVKAWPANVAEWSDPAAFAKSRELVGPARRSAPSAPYHQPLQPRADDGPAVTFEEAMAAQGEPQA